MNQELHPLSPISNNIAFTTLTLIGNKMDASPNGSGNQSTEKSPTEPTADKEEHWPLSGKPYFHVIFCKSYGDNLSLPTAIHSALPPYHRVFAASVAYRGMEWDMKCNTSNPKLKRLQSGWNQFVADNNIGIGDIIVFELLEFSNEKLKFRAQILRNRLPPEILQRMKGDADASASASTPTPVIDLDD